MMKEKIRALIVDDASLPRRRVRRLLSADPEIEIIGVCTNGRDAITAIQAHSPHLVFLDVEMPQIDGFDVLKAIDKEKMPLVIFVTAHGEYACRAFDVYAVDYLSMPYSDRRFREAVQKAKHRLRTEHIDEINTGIFAILEDIRGNVSYPNPLLAKGIHLRRLPVKKDGRVLLIHVTDINWIKAEDKYVRLHVGKESSYLLREAISNLETQLDHEQFLHIDRSYIVNIDRVVNFIPLSRNKYQVVFRDGTKLEVSKAGTERLRKLFGRDL
jgi:two-component system LytT family response regulator